LKKVIAALAATAALACVGAASAGSGLQLLQSSVTVRYGGHATLNGLAPTGTPVTLTAISSGKTAQGLLSTESNTTGLFHFEVAPTTHTVYVAQSELGAGKVVVNVMPRIGLLRNGTVRVAPVAAFSGRTVQLQQLVGNTWQTLMTTTFDANGVARVLHWTPGTTLRAYVPSIGHGFVAGTSRILTKDGGIVLR
jgi:hypothetical protein